ncbi:S26 family signal peptidase [Parasphingorhabdus sp.]|uniref:S26 family signal peptidase n=1 Tax=Parasphingorhabdus sp. TaxID=2709688 RepID=UPI003D28077E
MNRRVILYMSITAVMALVAATVQKSPPRLIWNASASVPIGLYSVSPKREYHVGDLVAAMPRHEIAQFLDHGGYVPAGVPLLKHVAAESGQTICRNDTQISVDGTVIGVARWRDSRDRELPYWLGCLTLNDHQIFLMNTHVPDSFDGRYFGPFERSTIVGRARPMWTDDTGNGRFVWHGFNATGAISQQPEGEKR